MMPARARQNYRHRPAPAAIRQSLEQHQVLIEERIRSALQFVDASDRDSWLRVGMAIKTAMPDSGFELWDTWSQSASNYDSQAARASWRSFKVGGAVQLGTLYGLAKANGWNAALPAPARPPEPLRTRQQSKLFPETEGQHERLSERGAALWASCVPLQGTIGEAYLKARGCAIPSSYGDLRFHPTLHHPSGYSGPGLVGLITDFQTNEPLSLHRTWICADGTKPHQLGKTARLLLAHHRKADGVIRLWPDDEVCLSLGLAEGLESALSLAHAHAPVWCAIDAGNLAALPVVNGIESLVIGADHDEAGLKAAHALAARWVAAGREVCILAPERGDLNDLAQSGAGEAAS